MESMRLHRVNFFNPQPKAIKSLSYDQGKSRIAVSRKDSSIEIWDVQENPYLEKICPGFPTVSVEAITWCSGRLFSVGLLGHINEHDLGTLLPKYQLVVTSGASLWCIKEYGGKYLAVGNEDGQVVIHELSSEGLNFEKKFDRQEGPVLCLDWHPDGEIIVTGSLDAIRVWNVSTGRVINRIMMTRSTKNTPTVVWCVAILRDMTIISGDSCSKTSFWDGNTGTLLTAPGPKERRDILTLCVNKEENEVFTCGVEPTIVLYRKEEESGKWMKSIQRVAHTHDVRALILTDKFLVSGGDDCNLVFTKYPPYTILKFYPFCQKSYTMTTSDPPCILLQYPDCVEVWSLPQTKESESKGPVNLIRVKTREEERIVTSAISSNGKYLAYSSQSKLRIFRIYLGASSINPEVEKIDLPPDLDSAANLILFTSNPCSLIVYSNNKYSFIKCDNLQPFLQASIEEDPDSIGETHLMELSPSGDYLACGSHNGHVIVYDVKNLKVFQKLPHYKCQPTALKFDLDSENLVVAYSDRKIIEYNLQKGAYTQWSRQPALFDFQYSYYTINSICFKSNLMILQDETKLYIFDRLKDVQQDKKRIKRSEGTFDSIKKEGLYKTVDKYEHISNIHTCREDLVVVHHSSNKILDFLPPPIYKKKFGT